MKKYFFVGPLFAGLFLISTIGAAQTAKISFVDSEVILRELPEAQQAQKELEQVVKGWQDELEKMGSELQKGLEEYQKKQALATQDWKDKEEKRLQELQQKAREFQLQKFDPTRGEAAALRQKKFEPIRDKILKVIEAVAKEDGFNFVFDKANDVLLLFADAKFDLTYKVIDRLKRGTAAPKGK